MRVIRGRSHKFCIARRLGCESRLKEPPEQSGLPHTVAFVVAGRAARDQARISGVCPVAASRSDTVSREIISFAFALGERAFAPSRIRRRGKRTARRKG